MQVAIAPGFGYLAGQVMAQQSRQAARHLQKMRQVDTGSNPN